MHVISRLAGILALAALSTLSLSASAQNATTPAKKDAPAAPAASTASPAKKELVKKALQLQQAGIEAVGAGLAAQTAGQVLQMAGPALSRVPEDKRAALVNDLQAEARKFQNDVTPMLKASAVKAAPSTLGAALEEKFSEDELKTLIAWLESPVSRKYSQISGEAQQAMIQKIVADTRGQIEPKLKALEQAMVAKLTPATGGAPAPAPAPAPAKPAEGAAKK